jgi:hypothetical protein
MGTEIEPTEHDLEEISWVPVAVRLRIQGDGD